MRILAEDWPGVEPQFWPQVARTLGLVSKKRPFLRRLRTGGRPRADERLAFGAILWRMRTGGRWQNLPARFGSAASARRRLARWSGPRLEHAWLVYLAQIDREELLRWRDDLGAVRMRPGELRKQFLALAWRWNVEPALPSRDALGFHDGLGGEPPR